MSLSTPAVRAPRGDLSRGRLVLSLGGGRRGRIGGIVRAVLVVAAFGAGVGVSQLCGLVQGLVHRPMHAKEPLAAPPGQAPGSTDPAPPSPALDQARLELRLAAAHGQELERQVDTLNQRLREAQEALTFFRKTRDARP